jgi:branched-subunit amino acid aminotransferase/4-amino-4-deoxychorismate lyase
MEEIHAPGIEIGERVLTPAELESADEVFITSTTRNLLPVFQIEGKKVGPGERVRRALQKEFSAYVRRYIAERKQVPA